MPKKYSLWTRQETELLSHDYSDLPNDLIAAMLGKTRQGIEGKARSMGLKKSPALLRQMRNLTIQKTDGSMTARQAIEEHLSDVRRTTSNQIHSHVDSLGFSRNASQLALLKLVNDGIVRRSGQHKSFECWLSEDDPEGLVFNAGTSGNRIFEQCRASCRILQVDRLLAQVRSA